MKPWKTREGHSSCVRGLLAVSSTETPLLISCGGRNEVFFWTVSPRGDISFLWGSPRGKKESEDQRVMCVAANGARKRLLVAAGDSRGKLRFFTVEGTQVKVAGEVTGHVTPILAIAMTRDGIVIAGTAAGDLIFLRCKETESAGIDMGEVIVDPAVHVMGINGIAIQETEGAIRCFTVGRVACTCPAGSSRFSAGWNVMARSRKWSPSTPLCLRLPVSMFRRMQMEQAYVLVEPWVLKYWNCLFSVFLVTVG